MTRTPRRRPALHRAALAVLAVAAAAAAARATMMQRTHVASGDTMLGDVLRPGDFDEFLFEAPRGANVALTYAAQAPGAWRPYMGVTAAQYAPSYGLYLYPGRATTASPLQTSGTQRLLVSGDGGSVGGFRIGIRVLPQKSFTTAMAPGGTDPGPLTFGAVADADLTVKIAWKGPAPVTLASIEGPDGPVVSATPARTGKKSSLQTGFRTAALGDHVATFTVPEGTVKWSASIGVRSPKDPPGTTHDVRSETVGTPPFEVRYPGRSTGSQPSAHPLVGFAIRGERGGPNDVIVLPRTGFPDQIEVGLIGRETATCAIGTRETGPAPGSFVMRCGTGASADITRVDRDDDGRVTRIESPDVRSPDGTGSLVVDEIEYDSDGNPARWRTTQTYDASGRTHVVRVLALTRGQQRIVLDLRAEHEAPDGTRTTLDFTPVSLQVR